MKISVIVPVYNVEAYVEQALNSLLEQDYQDYEVIIIDDGSKDGSSDICKSFALKDKRFKYYRQENQGLSMARNNGFDKTIGEIIYFFDSDDLLSNGSFTSWVNSFSDETVDAILFEAEVFTEDEGINFFPEYKRMVRSDARYNSDDYIAFSSQNKCYVPGACCYVARKTILIGHRFYPGIVHEDELFYFELFSANQHKVLVQNHKFFKRRVRINSIMTSAAVNKRLAGYETCIRVIIEKYKSYPAVKLAPIIRLYLLYLGVFSTLDSHKRMSIAERRKLFIFYLYVSRVLPFSFKCFIGSLVPELLTFKRYLSH